MSMDIEKICRTCLALSGPLLSMFDGALGNGCGSGCVADMLGDFTKMKPKPTDNFPQKVCLTCISEINRCYSFKMKCENANKTLRQLIPDAVDEVEDLLKAKVIQVHKGVQTETESPKSQQVEQFNQSVQTDGERWISSTSSGSNNFNTEQQTTVLKTERVEKQEFSKSAGELKVVGPTIINGKLKQVNFEDQSDGDIIFELQTDNAQEANTTVDNNNAAILSETDAAYYVYSDSQDVDEDKDELRYESETELQISNIDDEETFLKHDYNFTIIQTVEDHEEAPTATATPTSLICVQSKLELPQNPKEETSELKCPECSICCKSVSDIKTHCLKIHHWREEELDKLDISINNTIQETQNGELEAGIHDDLQEAIMQELQEQNASDKEEQGHTDSEVKHPTITTPNEATVFCPRCNAGFAYRKSMNHHMKQNQCTLKTFPCSECQRVFTSERGLKDHQEFHIFQYTCSECNDLFADKMQLSQHLIQVHKRSEKNQCKICNKVFTMVSALKDHLRIHSGEKPFLCQTCGKSFRQNANLKQHVMRHSKIKPYKCDDCSVSFVSKAELFSHKRTHTGDHPFKCEFCGTRYTTSSSLVKHRRKHTGERPYACEFCPMRFSALNVLKNHRRTHTGEKPFTCVFCNKGFTQKSDCQIHQRTHTGEKRYNCACGASFTHLSSMRIHQKIHDENDDGSRPKKRRRGKPISIATKVDQLDTAKESDSQNDVVQQAGDDADVDDATADEEIMEITMEDVC